jgi:hypothetical protein
MISKRGETDPKPNRVQVDLQNISVEAAELDSARAFLNSVLSKELAEKLVLKVRAIPPDSPYGPYRAYASGDTMYLPTTVRASTIVHEAGHLIDSMDKGKIGMLSHGFLVDRTKGEQAAHLGSEYKPDEVAAQDKFREKYTGKYYPHPYTSEVLSMGLQHLFEGWAQFSAQDRDHFNYTIAAITGELLEKKP